MEELFPSDSGTDVYSSYRARLYYRGAVPTRPNQAAIPRWILHQEQQRGFTRAGAFRRRLRFLTDGLAIGPAEKVAQLLETYRKQGRYRRRRHPIPQLGGEGQGNRDCPFQYYAVLRGGHGHQPDADPFGPGLSARVSEQQLEAQLDVPGLARREDPAEGG